MRKYFVIMIFSFMFITIFSCLPCQDDNNPILIDSGSSFTSSSGQVCPQSECLSAPQNMLDIEGQPCWNHLECQQQVKWACYDTFCEAIGSDEPGYCHLHWADDGLPCAQINGQIWTCDMSQKCCPPIIP